MDAKAQAAKVKKLQALLADPPQDLDAALAAGKLTPQGKDVLSKALAGCPHKPQCHADESGVFLVLDPEGNMLDGGWYCDPEAALAAWEAHVGPKSDAVLFYVS